MATIVGTVSTQRVGGRSKSAHEAVVVKSAHEAVVVKSDVSGEVLILRRKGENAFSDPVLEGLVGKRMMLKGKRHENKLFFVVEFEEMP